MRSASATPGHVVLAVIIRGIEAPCQVSRVSEVLAWIVPLFGDEPGLATIDLRCPCPDLPIEVERERTRLRAARSPVHRLLPGRRGRTVRLDLTSAEDREAFALMAPWSVDARVRQGRKNVLAVGEGTRSFWVELPKDKAEDLQAWFRRRGLGKLIDMDDWAAKQEPARRPSRKERRTS